MSLLKIVLKELAQILMLKDFVVTQIDELYWEGKYRRKLICKFHYLKDHKGYWVTNIWTDEPYRQLGFGSKMIKEAIKEYDKVFICSLSRLEFNKEKQKFDKNANDTRYPIDGSLLSFAEKCIEKKIIKQEWLKNPFEAD